MNEFYKEDLAFIHDVGFSDWALKSMPAILEILEQNKICEGLVVDLGCGTGLSAKQLVKANYCVLGIDISKSAIAIARQKVPEAEFRVESLFTANIPLCNAVISIGECLNYLFDSNCDRTSLIKLFEGIYSSLIPGGVFIFDIAEPGQIPPGITKGFTEGTDWFVLVEKEEDRDREILTRRIITFRKQGENYRRDDEIHRQQLYKAKNIVRELDRVGFQVQTMPSYGQYKLPIDHTAFIARKPE